MIFKPSRNAECLCGSEKKYKFCCIGKLPENIENYYGLLQKEGIIKNKLMRWFSENLTEEEIDDYSYDFNGKKFSELEGEGNITSFLDWFFLEAKDKNGNEKFLGMILRDFSELFYPDEIAIINEWIKNTQAGIFEVTYLDKDRHKLTLKEVFTNKVYEITDVKASVNLIKLDVIFARVQKIFSNYYISGIANSYDRFMALGQLKKFVEDGYNVEKTLNPDITYEQFMNDNSKFLNNFEAEIPKILAYDGTEAKSCEALYDIDSEHIEKILDWFENDKEFIVTEIKYSKNKFKSANISCINRRGDSIGNNEENSIRFTSHFIDEEGNAISTEGGVDINGNELLIHTISENVLNKLMRKIDKNVGHYLILKNKETKSMTQLSEREEKDKGSIEDNDLKMKGIGKAFMIDYYKKWCYQKIPALVNITPKQAVKTKEGRELLKRLLAEFENHERNKEKGGLEYIPVEKIIRDELNFYET